MSHYVVRIQGNGVVDRTVLGEREYNLLVRSASVRLTVLGKASTQQEGETMLRRAYGTGEVRPPLHTVQQMGGGTHAPLFHVVDHSASPEDGWLGNDKY